MTIYLPAGPPRLYYHQDQDAAALRPVKRRPDPPCWVSARHRELPGLPWQVFVVAAIAAAAWLLVLIVLLSHNL